MTGYEYMQKFLELVSKAYKTILFVIACFVVASFLMKFIPSLDAGIESQKANLALASKKGAIREVTGLLSKINDKTGESDNLVLILASRYGRYELFKSIFKDELRDKYKLNDMFIEASKNGNTDIVEFLLEKNIDINYQSPYYADRTALMLSSLVGHKDIVKLLIQKGADLNITDSQGHNALFFAALDGREDIVTLLIKKGTNVHQKYADWQNILLLATYSGLSDVAEALINKNVDTNTQTGYSTGKDYYYRNWIYNVGENKMSLLQAAIEYGSSKLVRLILSKNPNINVNQEGEYKNTPILYAAESGQLDTVKYLLAKGADIKSVDESGNNILMKASASGNIHLISYLIEKGFDANYQTEYGDTPIMRAAECANINAFNFLVAKGSDYKYMSSRGKTALFSAIEGNCTECVSFLVSNGLDVNQVYDDETPIMVAVRRNNIPIAKILLENGANVNIQTGYKQNSVFTKWQDDSERKEILALVNQYKNRF